MQRVLIHATQVKAHKIHAVLVTIIRKQVNRLVLVHVRMLAKPQSKPVGHVMIRLRLVLQLALTRATIIRVLQKFFQEQHVVVLMIAHKNARTAALAKVSHRLVVLWTRQPKIRVAHVLTH